MNKGWRFSLLLTTTIYRIFHLCLSIYATSLKCIKESLCRVNAMLYNHKKNQCCLCSQLTRFQNRAWIWINQPVPHIETTLTQIPNVLFEVSVHSPNLQYCLWECDGEVERQISLSYRWKQSRPTLPQREREKEREQNHSLDSLLLNCTYACRSSIRSFPLQMTVIIITQQQRVENVIWHAAQWWKASC